MKYDNEEANNLGTLLLNIGSSMLQSGAGTSRITVCLSRIASQYAYKIHADISMRSLSLILLHPDTDETIFVGRRSFPGLPGVNFQLLSEISTLSWRTVEEQLPIGEVSRQYAVVSQPVNYPRWLTILIVGIAGAGFCYIFGGTMYEMLFALTATTLGLFVKQEMTHRKYNPYVTTYTCALIAAAIVSGFHKLFNNMPVDAAFTTCTLFLIPGVPLLNAFIDLMDGYIGNGIDRGINGLMHAFSIAAGLTTIIHFLS